MNDVEPAAQSRTDQAPGAPIDRQLGTPDFLLGIPAAPLLLFVLMFATSGMTDMLARPGSRRKFLAGLLALEVLLVGAIIVGLAR